MDFDPMEEELILQAVLLPFDVVEEFLRRLTVRPLMRMRVVSQEWNNLISSRAFGRRHREQMRLQFQWMYYFFNQAVYRTLPYEGRFIYMRTDRMADGGENQVDVLCSCSSIICGVTVNNEIFLLNPLTHRISYIEEVLINCPPFVRTGRVSYSLGYNETEDDLLLVRITLFGGEVPSNEVVVYSRNSRIWILCDPFPFNTPILRTGVYLWGHLHWLVHIGENETTIASLSTSTLTYNLLTVAVPGPDAFMFTHLDRLGDEALCLYSTLTHRGGVYRLCILTNYNNPHIWQTVNIYLGDAICLDEFYVNLQPLQYVDEARTLILFRVNPVGSFMVFNTANNLISLLQGDYGIEGHVNVVRFLQTLEDPGHSFF